MCLLHCAASQLSSPLGCLILMESYTVTEAQVHSIDLPDLASVSLYSTRDIREVDTEGKNNPVLDSEGNQ